MSEQLPSDPRDTARLEWLITGTGAKKAAKVMGSEQRGWSVCDCSNGLTFMSRNHPTWRQAIDAAESPSVGAWFVSFRGGGVVRCSRDFVGFVRAVRVGHEALVRANYVEQREQEARVA